MATIMEMPKLSDTMSTGSVARWLKKEGEKVSAGLPVIEIETDKATMEYESPASGFLLKILVGDNSQCPLQAPIAVIGKQDENWETALSAYLAKKNKVSTAQPAQKDQGKANEASHPVQHVQTASATETKETKASPLARKIAAERGIDLKTIQGTGPQGRVVQRDLLQLPLEKSQGETDNSFSHGPANSAFPNLEPVRIPHTNMRRTIARRLTESVNTAPHFFLTIGVNMSSLMAWRKKAIAETGEKFSVNDMVVFLTARALKQHPLLNASWQEDCIVQYRQVDVNVAVALPNGLMTPLVRNADQLSVVQIAKETKRLVQLAREGKLQPNDYASGTFSVSNLGMSGIEEFTAIINPPQSAILAVGAALETPVVLPGGAVGTEQRMKLTLSCDHRVIDGAAGAEFLKTLKRFFEDPVSALFLG